MRKRICIALAVLLVALAGVIARQGLRASREKEPIYDGKPLSVWLSIYYDAMVGSHPYVRPEEQVNWTLHVASVKHAIQHIGTNALPVLIERLQAQDMPLRQLMTKLADKRKLVHFHFKSARQRRTEALPRSTFKRLNG